MYTSRIYFLNTIDIDKICHNLSLDSVLIEFLRIRIVDFKAVPLRGESRWKSTRYIAFVIRSYDPNKIELLDLGDADDIDREIIQLRNAIVSGDSVGYDVTNLEKKIFDPIVK